MRNILIEQFIALRLLEVLYKASERGVLQLKKDLHGEPTSALNLLFVSASSSGLSGRQMPPSGPTGVYYSCQNLPLHQTCLLLCSAITRSDFLWDFTIERNSLVCSPLHAIPRLAHREYVEVKYEYIYGICTDCGPLQARSCRNGCCSIALE